MTRRRQTIDSSYFDALYAENSDPWGFATSAYEHAKYAHTLNALPQSHYSNALEVGCSIGVLTQLLAARSGRLLAIDAAESCLDRARERCKHLDNVAFARAFVPQEWPAGEFDLIVFSEVIYYLDAADVVRLAGRIQGALAPGGTVVLTHWTGLTDYPLTGDEAVELLLTALFDQIEVVVADRQAKYRLDVLRGKTQTPP